MKTISRRRFLKTSLAAAASAGLASTFTGCQTHRSPVHARVIGANDDVRVGVIGFNGRGRSLLNGFRNHEGVRVTALCDADRSILEREAGRFRDRNEAIETYVDVRELLESRNVDAVVIATPNHWHALMSIWACQAGKDVFVEKPVSHNVWEGRKIVEAARKYNRMVQTGTQSRSSPAIAEAIEWVNAGNLGRVTVARGLCYKRRDSIGKVSGHQPIPENIDYDLWLGPAPMEPLRRARLHYDWHWVWATGNGDIGNQGIHQMDIARWFLGEMRLSPEVFSIGGRVGYDDDGETPNTQFVIHNYERAPLIFEVRGLPEEKGSNRMDRYYTSSVGVIIHCEGGYIVVPNYTSAIAYDKNDQQIRRWSGTTSHHGNFISAMRSGNKDDLNADILEGHLSSALCHVGNISHLLGRQSSPEDLREQVRGNPLAQDCLERMEEHLGANGVSIHAERLTLGAFLTMNPGTERFIGNREANLLLSRDYREPYVVPGRV